MTQLTFKRAVDPGRLTWGRPDSVPTAICSCCSGALPEVPVILWDERGYTLRLCDGCFDAMLEVRP